MSTKCTILFSNEKGKSYHLYFDYDDDDYHLTYGSDEGYDAFVRRIGKLLENCTLSDSQGVCSVVRKLKQKLLNADMFKGSELKGKTLNNEDLLSIKKSDFDNIFYDMTVGKEGD